MGKVTGKKPTLRTKKDMDGERSSILKQIKRKRSNYLKFRQDRL
jgi:hypothetical protein